MFKKIIVANLFLLLLGIYLCEVIVRLLDGTAERDLKMAIGWKPLMPVWHQEVAALQDRYQLPLLGSVPSQKTILCNDGYGLVSYASDRLGFRNRNSDYSGSEILIIGDSFLHGWCHKDDPGSFLRKKGLNAVNLSMAGYHPYQYQASLESFARLLDPKVVVLGIYLGNDYGACDGCNHRYAVYRDRLLPVYVSVGNVIRVGDSYLDKSKTYYRELSLLAEHKYELVLRNSISYFFKLGKLRQRAGRLFSGIGSEGNEVYRPVVSPEGVKASLRSLGEVCNEKTSCTPIVVTVPSNEPGESLKSRGAVEAIHLSLISGFRKVSPGFRHLYLDSKTCGNLFDEPGRHLAPRANDCMNKEVFSLVSALVNAKSPSYSLGK